MTSRNFIQELIQQIKKEYQEGVDFEIKVKGRDGKHNPHWVGINSPQLKKVLREKFYLPAQAKGLFLDYHLNDFQGNWFTYRMEENSDYLLSMEEWKVQDKTGNCKQCNEFVVAKGGLIRQWDGRKKTGEPCPNIIAYFHSECARDYFANQNQPNQNDNARIKEKLLRNLDKLCLDPTGWLANDEIVKRKDLESVYYDKNNSTWKEIENKIHKVEIEDQEIDLIKLEGEVKSAVRKAIIQEIKQNPQDWKIEKSTVYKNPARDIPDSFKILEHKSGRRHWNVGIIHFNDSLEKGKQDWAEIEAVLNGKSLPVVPNNKPKNPLTELTLNEKETIRNYMEKNGITSLFLFGNRLIAEYKDKRSQELTINNSESQNIRKCLAKTADKTLSWEQIRDNTNSPNQPKSPNYAPLWISLGIGGGIVMGALVAYGYLRKRGKK